MVAADLEEVRYAFTRYSTIPYTKYYFCFIGTSLSLVDVELYKHCIFSGFSNGEFGAQHAHYNV